MLSRGRVRIWVLLIRDTECFDSSASQTECSDSSASQTECTWSGHEQLPGLKKCCQPECFCLDRCHVKIYFDRRIRSLQKSQSSRFFRWNGWQCDARYWLHFVWFWSRWHSWLETSILSCVGWNSSSEITFMKESAEHLHLSACPGNSWDCDIIKLFLAPLWIGWRARVLFRSFFLQISVSSPINIALIAYVSSSGLFPSRFLSFEPYVGCRSLRVYSSEILVLKG